MTSLNERADILNEYGAWVQEKTLAGLDVSIEAYLDDLEHAANAEKLEAIRTAAIEGSAATFRAITLEAIGIKEATNELN